MTKVVTIDGPSGVGKGTISEHLANKLRWNYLNSGALYRAIAWVAKNDSIELHRLKESYIKYPDYINDYLNLSFNQ